MASGAAQENGESLAGTDLVRVSVALAAGFAFPGLGHVPHFEAPEKTYPPLLAYLKEGLTPK